MKKIITHIIFIQFLFFSSCLYAQTAQDCLNNGFSEFESGNYVAALELFDKALELKKDWDKALVMKARCHIELMEYNQSLDCAVKLLSIDPFEPEYYYLRGRSEWRLNRLNTAIENLEKALLYNHKHVEALQTLGYIYSQLNFHEKAKSYYDKALQSHPSYHAATLNKSKVQKNISDIGAALHEFNNIINQDSSDITAFLNRGLLKEIMKDNEGAYQDYNKCIELDPEFFIAYYYRGMVLYHLGRYKESLHDIEFYLKFFPKDETAQQGYKLVKKSLATN
jgi:tetratricopeptide (TPR) repeat protein